jgi:hypothetical protein
MAMRRHGASVSGAARRAQARPRYARIGVLLLSLGLTLGSAGVAALGIGPSPLVVSAEAAMPARDTYVENARSAADDPGTSAVPVDERAASGVRPDLQPAVPSRSGQGRRVVFDMSDQRVWLVRGNGTIERTYLVSGSRVDNLQAGTYEVYSRSLHATGYTGTTTMNYMVRFTTGDEAAIGFHDIPVNASGRPVQGLDELGNPTSAGCIRQRTMDARRMWAFAQTGTRVVVVN